MTDFNDEKFSSKTAQVAYARCSKVYSGAELEEDDRTLRENCCNYFVSLLQGKQVLELGCGPGKDSIRLHNAGCDVLATDICSEFLNIVGERYPQLHTQNVDMTALPFSESSFDGVYVFASFIHISRQEAQNTLTSIRKILKHGGLLFMCLIKSQIAAEYIVEDWGGIANNQLGFVCWEPDQIKNMLIDSGFSRCIFPEFSFSQDSQYNSQQVQERIQKQKIQPYFVVAFV